MICKCGSERIAHAGGKCSDLSYFSVGEREHDGYVACNVGIGCGDYIQIVYCLDCGQIQGNFPISEEAVDQVFKKP